MNEDTSPTPKANRWLLTAVMGITFAAFLPALRGEFLNWDDDKLIVQNAEYRGLGPTQIAWMFTYAKMGHYQPLTWLSYAVDFTIWGMDPRGYHLTNVLVHSLNAGLFFVLALVILRRVYSSTDATDRPAIQLAAAIAALFFGVHPLRVESVAWVTERRDVLSMFFLLLCVILYLRAHGEPGDRFLRLAASFACLTLSLLCKAWAVTLPVVLLVLDAHPLRRRLCFRLVLEKIPLFAVAGAAAAVSFIAQRSASMESVEAHGRLNRMAQAGYGLCFYTWKTLLPTGLSPLYEIPVNMNPLAPKFMACGGFVILITLLLLIMRRRWPAGLACWAIYVIVLFPVLGLAQTGPQLVADRYSYVACGPWVILAGAALCSSGRRWLLAIAGGAVVALSAMTWRQCGFWRTSSDLWQRCIAIEPDSRNGHTNLGTLEFENGRYDAAVRHLQKALALEPTNETAMVNVGSALARLGRSTEAAEAYRRATKNRVRSVSNLANLADGLSLLGHYGEACPVYEKLIALDPNQFAARMKYGRTLELMGRPDEAIASIEVLVGRVEMERQRFGGHSERWRELTGIRRMCCEKLAELFERKGDRASARKYFELSVGP